MTNREFAEKARFIAEHTRTAYLWGTFGAPISEKLIVNKSKQYPARYSESRQKILRALIPIGVWAWDCVGLIKGILWGWNNDATKSYGGGVYQSNGVPDLNVTGMTNALTEKTGNMTGILPGEAVYKAGHIGIYLGDGKVAEATLSGALDGVVITDLDARGWLGHGKLPYLTYEPEETGKPAFSVGDTVFFAGGAHYTSANGNTGYTARAGQARITRHLPGKKHPYHVIHADKTSNVYGWVNEDTLRRNGEIAAPQPDEPNTEQAAPQVGDTVFFAGGTHYTSANGNTGYAARAGEAKITRYVPDGKHPYHVIHTDKTSNVYGWVDAETVRK